MRFHLVVIPVNVSTVRSSWHRALGRSVKEWITNDMYICMPTKRSKCVRTSENTIHIQFQNIEERSFFIFIFAVRIGLMATWFGTLVGVMGLRTTSTRSAVTLIRSDAPRFLPWMAVRSSVIYFPDYSSTTMMGHHRYGNSNSGSCRTFVSLEHYSTLRGGENTQETGTAEPSTSSTSSKVPQATVVAASYPTSVCSVQGYRSYMEDEYFVSLDGDFAAVFDGHGGPAVSRYLRKNLYANIQAVLPVVTPPATTNNRLETQEEEEGTLETENERRTHDDNRRAMVVVGTVPTVKDFQTALESALEKVDREVQRISHWSYQGSTALVVWIHEERQHAAFDDGKDLESTNLTECQRTIIAANIGDSRAVLCRNNTAWELTRDHKPNDPTEQARIESLGGKVIWCGDVDKKGEPILERGIYRVNGNLALSRAIGDRSERPHVTAEPEVIAIPLEKEDEFIILATDGLWDVFESNEAVDLVQRLIQQGLPRDQVATWIVEESIRRGSYDNVTVVIVWLDFLEAHRKA